MGSEQIEKSSFTSLRYSSSVWKKYKCAMMKYSIMHNLDIQTWIAWDYILVCVCVCVCMYVWCACVSVSVCVCMYGVHMCVYVCMACMCVCVFVCVCVHRGGSASCSLGFINSQCKSQVACTHLGKQQVWAFRSLSTYWAVHQPPMPIFLQWDGSWDTSSEYYVILN